MAAEINCSRCKYLTCYQDGFKGRVIVNPWEKGSIRKSAITIEKCDIATVDEGQSLKQEVALIDGLGWGLPFRVFKKKR